MALLNQKINQFGRLKLLVGGEWKESSSDRSQQVFNPATGEQIGEVPFASKEEVDDAVEAAQMAYDKWKNVPITERVRYLFKLKQVLEREYESLSLLNTEDGRQRRFRDSRSLYPREGRYARRDRARDRRVDAQRATGRFLDSLSV
jgi:acyl-CoA reductase-like NAD-dependent aldehyde dehydrogenase